MIMERRYSSIAAIALAASSALLDLTMASKNGLRSLTSATPPLDGDAKHADAKHANQRRVAVAIMGETLDNVVPSTSLRLLQGTANDIANSNSACMEQASGISLGCTAQDIKFTEVTGFDILSGPNLLPCNCSSATSTCGEYDLDCGSFDVGTVFGACNGGNGNDEVTVQMNVNFLVSTTRYDIGMYIATDGGSALDGEQCDVSSLQYGTYGDVQVWEVEGDSSTPNPAPDNCYDLGSTGLLADYPFAPVTLSCTDSNNDGLLDFDIGIVWSVKKGDYDCDIDNVQKRPVASSSPKCWYDENFRAMIPIYVPPSEPIIIDDPIDTGGEDLPIDPPEDCIDDFNLCFALDMSGSVCNRGANVNCENCLLPHSCQDDGFTQGQCCANFEKVRQFAVDMTNRLKEYGSGTIGTSVVEFSTGATTIGTLSTNVTETLVGLDGMIYAGGWTDHADAITTCQATFASSAYKKNIILLVTDGVPTMPGSNPDGAALASATTAKAAGTVILPVFISSQNNPTQLNYMKSLSNDGTALDVSAFNELNGLIVSVTTRVLCGNGGLRAIDDYAKTPMETPVIIPVLENDVSAYPLVAKNITDPSNGVVYSGGTLGQNVEYYPADGFQGTDTFTYLACDAWDRCDEALVIVVVGPPAIVAINDNTSTHQGTPVVITILPNDNGEELTVQDTTKPPHGEVVIRPDKTVLYTPDSDFVGQDTFTYTTCEGESNVCDTATVTVDVSPPAIVAVDDSTSTPKGTPVTIAVLPNDSGEELTVQDTTDPSNGDVVIQPDGTVLYTPDPNFVGQDTFTYTACVSDSDYCDTATVTVDVINQPPVAIPDFVQMIPEDGPTKVIEVLANDYDPNGDPLVVIEVSDPVHGMVEISNSQTVTYTPTPAFSGVDTFEYIACDPQILCATALVTVIVNPNAVDDIESVQEGDSVTTDVLDNDLGADLGVLYVAPALNGICSITDSGLIKYTPDIGFVGQDECLYTACTSGTQACDTAKLIVNVSAEPTLSPSEMPSGAPTEAWYYPDWIDDSQVCKNDFAEPEYMLEVQRKNYLYLSKELCCQTHFWWRITQCMENEHPLYYSTGEKCDQKVFFEFYESKFTPADWSSSDLFETLEQCCTHKFWWDTQACMAKSPRELKYYFSLDVSHLNEPEFCQDADIIANALVTALERGLDDDMRADVTSIGCATITRNPDTGNPECGGCLAGPDFLGGTLGNTVIRDATGVVTTIQVEIRKKCYESKTDEDIALLTNYMTTLLEGYINPGTLTENIQSWSRDRIPAVGQLFDSVVLPQSLAVEEVINPFAPKDSKYYPDWVTVDSCVNDGMEPPYMQDNAGDYMFDNVEDCCNRYFATSTSCGSSSSG